MTTKTVQRDLLAAADYINEHGWCRNEFYKPNGQVCLAGAVGVVTGALVPAATDKRAKMLKTAYPDLPEKTVAEALDGKGDYADAYSWDWSRSRAARRRHGAAVAALAAQIDAERAAQLLSTYDENTARVADTMTAEERKPFEAERALVRAFVTQDLVTVFNDKSEPVPSKKTGKVIVKRTTKAQAVKLLQRAAAA